MPIRENIEMTEEDAVLYDKYKAEEDYYDRLQYVYKIKLNSYYGALTNLYFRFFDKRMGESTTGTGRMVLRHQCSKVNEAFGGPYALRGDAVIYGDTDSAYFRTFAENHKEAVTIADAIGAKVNASYKKFMQDTFLCQPGFDDIIKCGREIVSDRGIFVEKKRYILHVVDKEGKTTDELKVMGLDTKKTSLPKVVADVLNGFIKRLLKGEEWADIAQSVVDYKETLVHAKDITDLGLPKGVKDIDYFYDMSAFRMYAKKDERNGRTRVSGHVAAALHYNHCLEQFNDKVSMPIMDGMKTKIFYLIGDIPQIQLINGEMIKLKSISLPTDLEVIPQWFLDNFRVDIDAHIERLVDNPLENILKAIGKESPTKQSILVDSLFEF